MQKIVLTGVAAAGILSLVAAPAFAAPATTSVTHDVTADTAIEIADDYDRWGDAAPFAPTGAVSLPLTVGNPDNDFTHQSFAMSTRAPAGCVRTVNSFTVGYTLESFRDLNEDQLMIGAGVGTGEPLELDTLAESGVVFSGTGRIGYVENNGTGSDRAWLYLPSWSPAAHSASATLTFPEPVTVENARGYIGFSEPLEADWVVDTASFSVTDVCAGDAALPAIVPPRRVETGVAGTDVSPLITGTAAVGLLGAALAARRARRAGAR
ncbi:MULTISPECIES: hypothetical protein [unclassified Leucobacter]|uniref:hypothetical protein n=1 Tax=unclassified Leucobacter TaxID=2621730 RepID=UPI00165D7718|nr:MULTISPECIES: hypothetical protein [unclassified Leucobacter]MBC9937476.1 hypothetical protein [Leucobacter sp. cx-87]